MLIKTLRYEVPPLFELEEHKVPTFIAYPDFEMFVEQGEQYPTHFRYADRKNVTPCVVSRSCVLAFQMRDTDTKRWTKPPSFSIPINGFKNLPGSIPASTLRVHKLHSQDRIYTRNSWMARLG